MRRSLIENLDGRSILYNMAHSVLTCDDPDFEGILSTILNEPSNHSLPMMPSRDPPDQGTVSADDTESPSVEDENLLGAGQTLRAGQKRKWLGDSAPKENPRAPNLYAIDTEFYQPKHGTPRQTTEVAIVDVGTGQVVVNAVFGDDEKAIEVCRKVRLDLSKRKNVISRHVHQVRTVTKMAHQIKDCLIGPDNTLVEYSTNNYSKLDIKQTNELLEQGGFKKMLKSSSSSMPTS